VGGVGSAARGGCLPSRGHGSRQLRAGHTYNRNDIARQTKPARSWSRPSIILHAPAGAQGGPPQPAGAPLGAITGALCTLDYGRRARCTLARACSQALWSPARSASRALVMAATTAATFSGGMSPSRASAAAIELPRGRAAWPAVIRGSAAALSRALAGSRNHAGTRCRDQADGPDRGRASRACPTRRIPSSRSAA
jgi:hypothetical protein